MASLNPNLNFFLFVFPVLGLQRYKLSFLSSKLFVTFFFIFFSITPFDYQPLQDEIITLFPKAGAKVRPTHSSDQTFLKVFSKKISNRENKANLRGFSTYLLAIGQLMGFHYYNLPLHYSFTICNIYGMDTFIKSFGTDSHSFVDIPNGLPDANKE